jgi:hypothetical protein
MKTHIDGSLPENGEIFVFGSNLAGKHGRGAAYAAYKAFGAKYGRAHGLCGQSWGIPTKDEHIRIMEIEQIVPFIEDFIEFVLFRDDLQFFMTRVGCGLARYNDEDIAPLFKRLAKAENISWPEEWKKYLL